MEQTLMDREVQNNYERAFQAEESTMKKMGETLEAIVHTTEAMMDAVNEISDIVNSKEQSSL